MSDQGPGQAAGPRRVRGVRAARRPTTLRERLHGPWRVAVADASMRPSIEPGDWLLVDPTVDRWPRRGSVVVFREPMDGTLAIKRVAARPGDWVPYLDGRLQLGNDEAWLLGDASDAELEAAGFGPAVDSRRYGPVPLDHLLGRAWFRYAPVRRIGRLAPAPPDLLVRRGRPPELPAADEGPAG
jgi:signal peptidase I